MRRVNNGWITMKSARRQARLHVKHAQQSNDAPPVESTAWVAYADYIISICRGPCPPAAHHVVPPAALQVKHGSAIACDDGHEGADAPVLILLDMNGTLLYRAKKPLGIREILVDGSSKPAAAFEHGYPVPFEYYMRPGAAELVAALSEHPRARLGFYTSMRGANAMPAVRLLCPDYRTSEPEVYDRPFNTPDPDGANPWDTHRDFPLIWSTPGRAGTGFAYHNTVMVDDTPRKSRHHDVGLVVVPEFTEESVRLIWNATSTQEAEDAGDTRNKLEGLRLAHKLVLPRLTDYLRDMLKKSGEDVRPFLRSRPFSPFVGSATPSAGLHARNENGPEDTTLREHQPLELKGDGIPSESAGEFLLAAIETLLNSGPFADRFEPDHGNQSSDVPIEERNIQVLNSKSCPVLEELLSEACAAADRWKLDGEETSRLRRYAAIVKS